MKTFCFLLLLCSLGAHCLQAQQSLELHKRGSKTHYYFQAGDTITLALQNDRELSAVWEYAGDSAIWLADTVVRLKDIRWVSIADRKKGSSWNMPANLLIIAGVGYFAVDQLNTIILTDAPLSIDKGVVRASAGMLAAGLLIKASARIFRADKARIGKKYMIHLRDYSSDPDNLK